MGIDRKWMLAGGAALVALACSSPALAQPHGEATLDELIVTAQRRAENVQDVPITISVVGGEAITASGYKGLSDIQYLAPGVQFDPNNGGGFQVRGVGTQVFDYSTEQAVSIVIDDVVYDLPRNPGITSLTDIERVEVLKGPQGTLFGKNASAGVVSVVTKKPKLASFEADVDAAYGERNDRRLSATVNVPVGSMAALRISAFHTGQEGYGRYTFLQKHAGDLRDSGVRGKLLFRPSDNLELILAGEYSRHRDNMPYGALTTANAAYTALSAAAGVTVGPDNYSNADNHESYARYTNHGVSLTVNYNFGGHSLTSITAYRDLSFGNAAPFDFEPTQQYLPFNVGRIDGHKLSEEVRLTSPSEGRFRYVLGLYYNKSNLDSTQQQAGTLSVPLPPAVYLSLTNGTQLFHNAIESKAVFGQINFDLTERLELVLGGRLTRDVNSAASSFDSSPLSYVYIPISAVPNPSGSAKTDNFSYKISPIYKITDDIRVYATYATGYKGAGIAYLSGRKQSYGEETVKNIEVGLKTELMDRRLRFNINLFNQKYKDFQAQDIQFIAGVPVFLIVNAGGLRTRGVEAEFQARPTSALSLNVGVTYSESVFTDYLKSGVQLAGQRLTNAPRWSGVLGAAVTQPVGADHLLVADANVAYRSAVFLAVADPASVQKAYTLVNARLAFGRRDERWQAGIYARNLLDQHFRTQYTPTGFGVVSGWSNEGRRTIGVFAKTSF